MTMFTRSGESTGPSRRRFRSFFARNRRVPILTGVIMIVILLSYTVFVIVPERNRQVAYAASDELAVSVAPSLVAAKTKFGLRLFRALAAEETTDNIFVSPLSISTALLLTYNGAGGTTRDAIARTLELSTLSLATVNHDCMNLLTSLDQVDDHVDLFLGNALWMKDVFAPLVKDQFLNTVMNSFNAEIFTRDFTDPQTLIDINSWVDEKTEGHITNLIQTIDPEIVMLILNTLYFRGDWLIQFDEAETLTQPFFVSETETVNVELMTTSGNFSYYADEMFQAVRLPYGRGKLAMYIFLPSAGVTLPDFLANLNQTTHEDYLNRLHPVSDLTVKLPKFRVEYGVKRLNSVLTQLGMGIAFDPVMANLSGIAEPTIGNLFISFVDHKAIIEVTESGTEAAAATSVGIGLTAMPPDCVINRPFFFEIRDDRSGTILFMGQIMNPVQS
jgi:serine protease inhibitor